MFYVLPNARERFRYIMLSLRNAIQALMNDVFGIWAGPMEIHDEFLELLDNKSDRIKLMRVIRENRDLKIPGRGATTGTAL